MNLELQSLHLPTGLMYHLQSTPCTRIYLPETVTRDDSDTSASPECLLFLPPRPPIKLLGRTTLCQLSLPGVHAVAGARKALQPPGLCLHPISGGLVLICCCPVTKCVTLRPHGL